MASILSIPYRILTYKSKVKLSHKWYKNFQFPTGFSLMHLPNGMDNNAKTFNSLPDSHSTPRSDGTFRVINFQFPTGFSLVKLPNALDKLLMYTFNSLPDSHTRSLKSMISALY